MKVFCPHHVSLSVPIPSAQIFIWYHRRQHWCQILAIRRIKKKHHSSSQAITNTSRSKPTADSSQVPPKAGGIANGCTILPIFFQDSPFISDSNDNAIVTNRNNRMYFSPTASMLMHVDEWWTMMNENELWWMMTNHNDQW